MTWTSAWATSGRSSPPSGFAASASPIYWVLCGSSSLDLIKEFEELRGGEKVPPAVLKCGLGLRVGTPLLQLPAIVDGDRIPRLLRRKRSFLDCERGHQRAADRHQRRQPGQMKRVEGENGVAEPFDGRGR